jgi:predicted ATPase
MLTRASFENFKALERVDVDLSRFTLLVGKNSAGKTSVLQGMHHASQLGARQEDEHRWAEGRPGAIFSGSRDPRRLVTLPGHGPMRIALTDEQARTLSVEARLPVDESEPYQFTLALSGDEPSSITLPGVMTLPGERAETLPKVFFGLPALRRFASVALLRLDADVIMRPSMADSEQPRLEQNGEGLASVLNYFAGAEPAILDALTEDLAKVIPQVRGIRTFPAQVTRRRQERIVIGDQAVNRSFDEPVWGHRFSLDMGKGRLIPADLLSEGTVLTLGLLTALRHPLCPRLVLADDIDKSLHPGAQAELVRCIRAILAARPELQMVCTTHSPYLLDHVELDEVRVMALDAEGHAACRSLSDHPDSQRWREMLRTGEFWASVGEDWIVEKAAGGG